MECRMEWECKVQLLVLGGVKLGLVHLKGTLHTIGAVSGFFRSEIVGQRLSAHV